MTAVVGESGSGKSTLVDVIMRLLPPTSGRVLIDGTELSAANQTAWHRMIAHVPQAIFLADGSIADNIALSHSEQPQDLERIVAAAKEAQLHEFVVSLPDGYSTRVGERGVLLSGGQRQRLGLARAIYKQAPLLVLDEATSALDDRTEAAVNASLKGLSAAGRTIIIIAHRQSTIAGCHKIVELHDGRISDVRTSSQSVRQGA
jgi:ABC-type multidrug transport system fused ATPase/permease subunit